MKTKPKTTTKKTPGVTTVTKNRCQRMENGQQCHKLVSTGIKSGICVGHRQQDSLKQSSSKKRKKNNSSKGAAGPKPKQAGGGKDISQIREAMEADARLEYGREDDDDDLVIDLPH